MCGTLPSFKNLNTMSMPWIPDHDLDEPEYEEIIEVDPDQLRDEKYDY